MANSIASDEMERTWIVLAGRSSTSMVDGLVVEFHHGDSRRSSVFGFLCFRKSLSQSVRQSVNLHPIHMLACKLARLNCLYSKGVTGLGTRDSIGKETSLFINSHL